MNSDKTNLYLINVEFYPRLHVFKNTALTYHIGFQINQKTEFLLKLLVHSCHQIDWKMK